MEIGRLKLLEAIGMPAQNLEKSDIYPVLVNTEITYKQSIYYGDRVTAEVWISKLNLASAIIQFRFYKNGTVLAAFGNQKGLFINGTTHKPIKISLEQRSNFAKYLISEG